MTVVIPHYNRVDLLSNLLKQLAAQTYPILRTIVVDNGSTDQSVTEARAAGAEVLELGRNTGFAPAVNTGIRSAGTEWVAIVNNDVSPASDWLEQLVQAASDSAAAFASGKLLQPGNSAILDGGFDLVCAGGTAWRAGSGRPDGPLWSAVRTVRFPSMTASLFRRSLFDRVGLLDERFESYLEDVDFGLRCSAAGLSGVYAPRALATHQGSATRGAWHKTTVRQIARNQTFIVAKHFRGAPLWPVLVAQLLWGLLAARHMAVFAWASGKWEGVRHFRRMRATGGQWTLLKATVEASERELYELQRSSGFDAYWRWYFMLTRGRVN